jgi:hypothetical protein
MILLLSCHLFLNLCLFLSRPEIPVRYGLGQIPDTEHQDFVLHCISPAIVDHNISLFLECNLGLIGRELWLHDDWPGNEIVMQMVHNASGLFIWAATACRYIREGKRYAAKRLDTILHSGTITCVCFYLEFGHGLETWPRNAFHTSGSRDHKFSVSVVPPSSFGKYPQQLDHP